MDLEKALEDHEKWVIKTNPNGRAELYGKDFRHITLGYRMLPRITLIRCNFSGVTGRGDNFRGAALPETNFSGANMPSCSFVWVTAHDANFSEAKLGESSFVDADLVRANFTGAVLSGVNFSDADLTGANFTDALLTGAMFDEAILPDELHWGQTYVGGPNNRTATAWVWRDQLTITQGCITAESLGGWERGFRQLRSSGWSQSDLEYAESAVQMLVDKVTGVSTPQEPQKRKAKAGEARQFLLDAVSGHTDECVLWPFATHSGGYGSVRWGGRTSTASRVALELSLGRPLRKGLEAGHMCNVRLCINPAHLEEITSSENNLHQVRL